MTVSKLCMKINIIVTCAALVYCDDPDKTITVGSYKYELFNNGKTLAGAKTVCRDRNAWLVEIKYKEISDAMISLTSHDVIIGGKQLGDDWKWNDGSSMRYTNWATKSSSADCLVMIARDRTWKNIDCTTNQQRYICQSDISYKGSFLITAFGNSVTYNGAKTACEKIQARLVDIKTIALDSYVHTLLSSQDSWTSGRYEGGSWKWGDKSSIAGINLPSGKNNHCLMKTASNTWKSELCTAEAGYICQKNVTSGTCDDEVCLNGGTCTIIDERFKCLCDARYFGTKCEKRIIFINTSETEFTVGKVTILNVAFTIVSYDGDVTVMVDTLNKNGTSNITTNKLTASVYIKMGPFNANANSVKQVITAVSKRRNTKSNSITMTIKIDHCLPNPCKNEANCKNLDKEPYLKCECSPSYEGRTCEERIYVKKGNCTYHINIDEKVRFEQANSTCHNLAGSLAMMKTSSIQNFVETQVAKQYEEAGKSAGLWIGGIKREDSWYWLDGTSIPLDGSDAKWAGSSEYMANRSRLILGLYKSNLSNMRWFSRNYFGYGYVCEIAKIDLCKSITCKNGGKCVVIGCSNITNCQCVAGYTGIQCEKEHETSTTSPIRHISTDNLSQSTRMMTAKSPIKRDQEFETSTTYPIHHISTDNFSQNTEMMTTISMRKSDQEESNLAYLQSLEIGIAILASIAFLFGVIAIIQNWKMREMRRGNMNENVTSPDFHSRTDKVIISGSTQSPYLYENEQVSQGQYEHKTDSAVAELNKQNQVSAGYETVHYSVECTNRTGVSEYEEIQHVNR